jgi:hypothetical protein
MKSVEETPEFLQQIANKASQKAIKAIFKKGLRATIKHEGVLYQVAEDGTAYRKSGIRWRKDPNIRFKTKGGTITVVS